MEITGAKVAPAKEGGWRLYFSERFHGVPQPGPRPRVFSAHLCSRAGIVLGATYEALTQAGYRPGRVMVRMKRGENPPYDHAALYYCDSWL